MAWMTSGRAQGNSGDDTVAYAFDERLRHHAVVAHDATGVDAALCQVAQNIERTAGVFDIGAIWNLSKQGAKSATYQWHVRCTPNTTAPDSSIHLPALRSIVAFLLQQGVTSCWVYCVSRCVGCRTAS